MLLQLSASAQIPLRAEIEHLEIQPLTYPPHSATANLSSIDSLRGTNKRARYRKFDAQEKILDYIADHDEYGFRISGKPSPKSSRKSHLFLSGCSWTWGSGVENHETFAAHLEEKLRDHRVVNMGIGGGGPAETLYIWRNFDWQKVYPEQEGFLIYTIINLHYERLRRTWAYLSWARDTAPVFDDELKDSAPSNEHWDHKWAKFVKSIGLDYWWLRAAWHFTPQDTKEFNELVVKYLLAIKRDYLKRYPQGRFVITWMNFSMPSFSRNDTPDFIAALEEAGIEHWSPPLPPREKHRLYRIPRDGHPTPLAHREHAEYLAQKITDTI